MRAFLGVAAGSLVLAVLLQIANCVFEAAGSVPDIEGCGFLAGGIAASAIVFPAITLLLVTRMIRHFPGDLPARSRSPIFGAAAGLAGSGLYLSGGMLLALYRGQYDAFSAIMAVWSAFLIAVCGMSGWLGGLLADLSEQILAWRDSGS
jgi:hypothetical protein